jgi:O-antigen/teichoic acid export membrane protein
MNKIVKNSLFNVLRVIILTPIAFIIPVYTISKIGSDGYGLFALTSVITSYTVFINFGFGTSLIRYVAKAEARKDNNAISEYLATSMLIYLFFSITIGLIIFICRYFIVTNILNIKDNVDIAAFLISISVITIVINMISGLFNSIIIGLQRMDLSNGILTFNAIVSAITIYIVLECGYGLKGLAIKTLIMSFVSLIANVLVSKLILTFRINPFMFRISRFKEMFSYSINLQLSSIISVCIEPLNKILISHFFPVSYIAYYELALRFRERITILIRESLKPLFPAVAEIQERNGFDKIEKLRYLSTKYIFIITSSIFVGVLIFTPAFVSIWLGSEMSISEMSIVATVIIIFMAGAYMSLLSTPSWAILNGLGYSKQTLIIQSQVILVNIVGILVFLKLFGFYGLCIGFSLSEVYCFFATQYYYKKKLGKEIIMLAGFKDRKIIISNLLFVIVGIMFVKTYQINNFVSFLIIISLYLIIYFVFSYLVKIFGVDDLKIILGVKTYNTIYNFVLRMKRLYMQLLNI